VLQNICQHSQWLSSCFVENPTNSKRCIYPKHRKKRPMLCASVLPKTDKHLLNGWIALCRYHKNSAEERINNFIVIDLGLILHLCYVYDIKNLPKSFYVLCFPRVKNQWQSKHECCALCGSQKSLEIRHMTPLFLCPNLDKIEPCLLSQKMQLERITSFDSTLLNCVLQMFCVEFLITAYKSRACVSSHLSTQRMIKREVTGFVL
jgi:hypothetical protein